MIKVQSLSIQNFRGIRNLHLSLDGESLAVRGPNGSGKSGVVDAIEFALTGKITRLEGVGSGAVSIREHGPHVDFKDLPEKSLVVLVARLETGTTFSVERNVSAPSKPVLSPDTNETRNALAFVCEHPEFSLSRKEILKFVLTEAGKRAKEVQAILRLDAVDKSRAAFQGISNSSVRDASSAQAAFISARKIMQDHLKLAELTGDTVLGAVNERRTILGLPAITKLTPDIGLDSGLASEKKDSKIAIPRDEALKRLQRFTGFAEGSNPRQSVAVTEGISSIAVLRSRPTLLAELHRQALYEKGVALVVDDSCPLCGVEWELDDLRLHLQEKIKNNQHAIEIKRVVETALDERVEMFRSIVEALRQFSQYSSILGVDQLSSKLDSSIISITAHLKKFLKPFEHIDSLEDLLVQPHAIIPIECIDVIKLLFAEIEKLPDFTSQEAAKHYLTIAQERYSAYMKAKRERDFAKSRAATAKALLETYEAVSEAKLTSLYREVQNDFARYYCKLNSDDEAAFSAKLHAQGGGLVFEVDFYGRGHFPPNAYHSEGHQDSMGLCLYFALSRKLLGASFSLCLLDDVLMSVDAGHRREICKLLKSEFPSTQFIITTHDEVWGKQLSLEGVIKGKNLKQFRKWTVTGGPAAWDDGEIWKEIEHDIASSEIPSAAQGLRRYLEFIMTELSYKLRANVEAKPTASHDLGDLMAAVAGRYKDLLKKAKTAANSWNQKATVLVLAERDNDFGSKYAATNAEQWAVNGAIHFNEWGEFSPEDFKEVTRSFSALLSALKCPACESWFHVIPIKGSPETLKCDCGESSFNLHSK